MRTLEDWITRLLEQDPAELNRKYSGDHCGNLENEVDSLFGTYPVEFEKAPVDAALLQKLHSKIREQECEAAIWDAIIFRLSEPLPTKVAHDLIDRDIIVGQLGHTRQNDEVQWRLASLVEEALLTLFYDLYTNPAVEIELLQKLLDQHSANGWLLDKWEYWADEGTSPEKEFAFHRWAWRHPDRPENFPSPEEHAALMARCEYRKKIKQLQFEQRQREEQMRTEYETRLKCLELEHIAQDMLEEREIESVLSSQDPAALLALASNAQIQTRWIGELVNCHHIKGARQIREAADSNIKARSGQVED